ncbi:unnamed protein product [Chondrus crispus]|uniref:DUF4042 domain-containing protein n=1 Tax=Chondrus crispus TaxID=2769 RepID=R7QDU7_CHOCR|nr:unnamed protein product [Chondrus crispus]CDF35616.1 unnamed protein product [Chondrus crispus]|eukprot:XP_005715435.1 unnamed protein product [Chondrus crispus]
MFAANTIHARTRADWLTFANEAHFLTAFHLVLEGLERAKHISSAGAAATSPVHFFGKTSGFCLSMAHTPNLRDVMWASLISQLGSDHVLKCNALAAAVQEIDHTSDSHVETYAVMRAFCQSKAHEVLTSPVAVLASLDAAPLSPHKPMSIPDLRAAVLCLHAWQRYADRNAIASVLLKAIRVPQLADDASETLAEMVGYSGSNMQLLMGTCDGLLSTFQHVRGCSGQSTVHHAIAEVVSSLSDGNADELLEQVNTNSVLIVEKATQLLTLCLELRDDASFFASVQGWTSWITAANLVEQNQARLVLERVAHVVRLVVQRITSLQFMADLTESHGRGCPETNDELVCVRDLLLESTKCIGIGGYVEVIKPFFETDWNVSTRSLCAALFSVAVAGEIDESVGSQKEDRHVVLGLLGRILDLIETISANSREAGNGYASVKIFALSAMCSFAELLSDQGSEAEFRRALHCAGTGILDPQVNEKSSEFLYELADAHPERLRMFLTDLLSSGTRALSQMSDKAALNCVRGLAKVTSALETRGERQKALNIILEEPCKYLLSTRNEQETSTVEQKVCRSLGLVAAGLQEVNDNEIAMNVYSRLRGTIFEIAISRCGNETVSRAICRVLEVCVLPTLLDDEQPRPAALAHNEDTRGIPASSVGCGRAVLAMSCMSLAAECFRRSGEDGETVWLSAVAEIAPHVVEFLDGGCGTEAEGRALACLRMSLEHSLEGLQSFTNGNYDSRKDMAVEYFRFATRLLSAESSVAVIIQKSSGSADAGLKGLQCNEIIVVREALLWWKSVFGPGQGEVARAILAGAGGADNIARAFVCAARHTRCAGAVADALFALCKWVAQVSGNIDPDNVLRTCLTAAFAAEGVASLGLDVKVRETLYRSCISATGSMRDFRQALREFGRVYSLALISK